MKKVFMLITTVILLIAIPATVFLIGKNQEMRKKAAPATSLTFSQKTITKKPNESFTIDVVVDTGDNQIVACELYISYDPAYLKADYIVNNASVFPTIINPGTVDESGQVSITMGTVNAAKPFKGNTSAATIKFTALKKTDTPVTLKFAENTFVGSPGEGATNALSQTGTAAVTISESGQGSSSTPTSTPTPIVRSDTPAPTSRLTPTSTKPASSSSLLILSPVDETTITSTRPVIKGIAPAGSKVTITIYSEPITTIVTADANGNWTYTPTAALEEGEHTIVVTITDASGQTQTSTASFTIASGTSTVNASSQSAIPETGNVETTLVLIGIALFLMSFGIVIPLARK